jgi:PEGA domain
MSRVIAFVACGFTLAACSASMPSLDFFKSAPATETLRIESEPPGADARTTQGQTCRTPCELTVQGGGDLSVTVALNGYQPQTVALRSDQAEGKLSPNPLYVELQAAAPAPTKKKALKKKKPATAAAAQPAGASAPATAAFPPPPASSEPTSSANYPWPTSR